MTVAAALADFEARIAAVEAALDADEDIELHSFAPMPLVGPAGKEQLGRLQAALARLNACQLRLDERQEAAARELETMGARREAAAAYIRHD